MNQQELEDKIIFSILRGEAPERTEVFEGLEQDHFLNEDARRIFTVGLKLYLEGRPADLASIMANIHDARVEQYALKVVKDQFTVTSYETKQYVLEIQRAKRIRDKVGIIRSALYGLEQGNEDALIDMRLKLDKVEDQTFGELIPVADASANAIRIFGDIQTKTVASGFRIIDHYFGGLAPGRLILLAAETGAGKSALAANIALNVARRGGVVLYISLEMPADEIVARMLVNKSGVSATQIRTAIENGQTEIQEKVMTASEEISGYKMQFYNKRINAQRISMLIRQMKAIYKACDLVIVDYLQLVGSIRRTETREREIADISRTLKEISMTEETCVLALSQVNRNVDARESEELFLSDIRESAAPTHDADAVLLLYHSGSEEYEYMLKLGKSRKGKIGARPVIFNKELQRFTDEARKSEY